MATAHRHIQIDSGEQKLSQDEGNRGAVSDAAATYSSGGYSTAPVLRSRSRSPSKRSQSPTKTPRSIPHSSTGQSSVAARRDILPPTPIDTNKARDYQLRSARKPQDDQQPFTPSPQHSPIRPSLVTADDSSSFYSQDGPDEGNGASVSPLRISKIQEPAANTSALRSYNDWAQSTASPERLLRKDVIHGIPNNGRGIPRTVTMSDLRHEGDTLERTWSPLSDYLTRKDMPVRKEMVGARGWLERTTESSIKSPYSNKKTPQPKKGGLLEGLKKIAKDMKVARKPRESDRERRVARLTVSLDPREQSLLYCELEFILTTALDGYITSQFNAGRLEADKYKRISDGWQQKGRPKVVGFRYDLETQLELVYLHSPDFRFYGRRAGVTVAVNGLLEMMKVNARAMRIRTFCQPDTVIAKQLLDSQSLFNMLGCSEAQQIRLAEVIQFFKIILEREATFHHHHEAPKASMSAERDTGHWDDSHDVTEEHGARSHSEKYQSSGADQAQDYGA